MHPALTAAVCLQINMMAYVRDLEKAKKGEGGIPDRQNLAEARRDLDKVLQVHPCLRTHLEMAQVLIVLKCCFAITAHLGVDCVQIKEIATCESLTLIFVGLTGEMYGPSSLRRRCIPME